MKEILQPVITLVFYYGTKEWDGKNDLYEMFNIASKSDADIDMLMRYVPNYRINLIEPMNIEDLSRFKTDLQMMFGVLKCRQDRTKMLEYV